MHPQRLFNCIFVALMSIQTSKPFADTPPNWPSFRGPGSYGHAKAANPPLDWDGQSGKHIVWKVPVPKPGMSSPVVWDQLVILTGGDADIRLIYGFSNITGKLLWRQDTKGIIPSISQGEYPQLHDGSGFAASTATVNGQAVAAIFATGELLCVNHVGHRLWSKNLGFPRNHYGHASSLLEHKGVLYVQYDQKKNSSLMAFEMLTGKLLWQVERSAISWSSPILIQSGSKQELILTNGKTINSYDPTTGKLRWEVPGMDGEVAPSAAYGDGRVFIANEYAAAAGIAINQPDRDPEILWAWTDVLPDAASPLANDQVVIIPSGYGIMNCLDAATGQVYWEHEFEEGFYASPILVDDKVYALDLKGTMQIFEMAKGFKLLSSPSIDEKANATPAFVGSRIYIRGSEHLFCIGANDSDDQGR